MSTVSRRRFLQLSALTGGTLMFGNLAQRMMGMADGSAVVYAADSMKAADPIRIGILDPLAKGTPYTTSSIHDVHGANVAVDLYNKRGGVLGRQVAIIEADDASNVQTALKAATKLIKEDKVDFLMGTFNGDVSLAVS